MCTPTQEDKPDQIELLKLKLLYEPATTPILVNEYMIEHSCECVRKAARRIPAPKGRPRG
jgi:hypothetical protein